MENHTLRETYQTYIFVLEGIKSALERITLHDECFKSVSIRETEIPALEDAIEAMQEFSVCKAITRKIEDANAGSKLHCLRCLRTYHRREKYGCRKGLVIEHRRIEPNITEAVSFSCVDCETEKCPEADCDVYFEALDAAVTLLEIKYGLC